ncbi:hypothetical protein C8Q73DRAFT_388339 [Cubamyces lactineus]|nr:hypothetical protein C8Q73DRAFT_388339 [Cubamyces lactineus]
MYFREVVVSVERKSAEERALVDSDGTAASPSSRQEGLAAVLSFALSVVTRDLKSLFHIFASPLVYIAKPSSTANPSSPSPHRSAVVGLATTLGKTSFGAVAEEDYPNSAEYIDDEEFEEISYDELRLSIYPADPAHLASLFGYQRTHHQSLLSRSRSSISRLRSLSRASLRRPRRASVPARAKDAQRSSESTSQDRTHSLSLSRPSSSDSSSRASSSPHTPPSHTAPLILEPTTLEDIEHPTKQCPARSSLDADAALDSYGNTGVAVSKSTPSLKVKSFTSSLRRLRTFSKSSLFSARKHAPELKLSSSPSSYLIKSISLPSPRTIFLSLSPIPSTSIPILRLNTPYPASKLLRQALVYSLLVYTSPATSS